MNKPESKADKLKASSGVGSGDLLGDFRPHLRNTSGNTWEAFIELPVVGCVTVCGDGWPEAKMRLWLVSRAVEILAARTRELPAPKDWTEDEWRSTLKTMGDVWSPNVVREPSRTHDTQQPKT